MDTECYPLNECTDTEDDQKIREWRQIYYPCKEGEHCMNEMRQTHFIFTQSLLISWSKK